MKKLVKGDLRDEQNERGFSGTPNDGDGKQSSGCPGLWVRESPTVQDQPEILHGRTGLISVLIVMILNESVHMLKFMETHHEEKRQFYCMIIFKMCIYLFIY